MSKKEKLLFKAQNNPRGLKFDEFCNLLNYCGWVLDHQTGSHQIWYSPQKYRISIQNKKDQAKKYQVKQFLTRYYEEGGLKGLDKFL